MTSSGAQRLWAIGLWNQYRMGFLSAEQVERGWNSGPPPAFVEAFADTARSEAGSTHSPDQRPGNRSEGRGE